MTNTNDPFREMAQAMRTRTGFDGTILKFAKGNWTAGKDGIGMNDAELIALIDRLMYGFIKWEDKHAVDFHIGFIADRFKPPKRGQLGDTDRSLWDKPNQDPWQMTFVLPLTHVAEGELYFFSTSSQGGRNCLASLQEAYADHRELHPQEAHKLPRIVLAADSYNHQDYGHVDVPLLDITGWVDPPTKNPKIKAIRPPAPTTPLPAIAAAPKSAPEIIENRETVTGHLDDDIPF